MFSDWGDHEESSKVSSLLGFGEEKHEMSPKPLIYTNQTFVQKKLPGTLSKSDPAENKAASLLECTARLSRVWHPERLETRHRGSWKAGLTQALGYGLAASPRPSPGTPLGKGTVAGSAVKPTSPRTALLCSGHSCTELLTTGAEKEAKGYHLMQTTSNTKTRERQSNPPPAKAARSDSTGSPSGLCGLSQPDQWRPGFEDCAEQNGRRTQRQPYISQLPGPGGARL